MCGMARSSTEDRMLIGAEETVPSIADPILLLSESAKGPSDNEPD